jgi:hypothetical protein
MTTFYARQRTKLILLLCHLWKCQSWLSCSGPLWLGWPVVKTPSHNDNTKIPARLHSPLYWLSVCDDSPFIKDKCVIYTLQRTSCQCRLVKLAQRSEDWGIAIQYNVHCQSISCSVQMYFHVIHHNLILFTKAFLYGLAEWQTKNV